MKPLVSIVILNWNGKKHLMKCLASLEHVSYKPLEVIVVDNFSADDSVNSVKAKFPRVIIIQNSTNRGYSGGNNDGIKASNGKYVFILNNDTEVEKNFLGPLVSLMESDTSLGCVQPKIVYGDERTLLNAVGSFLTSTGFLYHYGYRKSAILPQYQRALYIYSAKGAAMLLRKKALDRVGTFDEDFFIYFEETDLCHRLWMAGYKVVYEPSSVVYHYEAVDTHKQMPTARIMYLSYRNRIASYIKNLSPGRLIRLLPVLFLMYTFLIFFHIALFQWSMVVALVRAICWNILMLPAMLTKRKYIQNSLRVKSDGELFGKIWKDPPIRYYYYLFTTLKNFQYEPSIVETNHY